jgi:hypothetical protein
VGHDGITGVERSRADFTFLVRADGYVRTLRRWRLHTALTAAAIEKKKAPVKGPRCTSPPYQATDVATPSRQAAIEPAHQMRANCQRLRRSSHRDM